MSAEVASGHRRASRRSGRKPAPLRRARFCCRRIHVADAMFAPVATRFQTYAVALPRVSQAVCRTGCCGIARDAGLVRSRRAPRPNSCRNTSRRLKRMKIYAVGGSVRDELLGLPVERSRLRRGRRHARGNGQAGLQAGRQGFPGVPASRDPRGIRARAHRAQDRARLSRLRVPRRARRHARRGPCAARSDHQRDRAGRSRQRSSIRSAARPT